MKTTLFALAAFVAASAFGQRFVWDATRDGRLMTATNDIVLFKNVSLATCRLDGCWFNKGERRRVDGTRVMCNGRGTVCHAKSDEAAKTLTAQCQLCTEGWTKCVKLQLRQAGSDIVGRILYARYYAKSNVNKVGADFDTLSPVNPQEVYSVLPSGRATDGYNVDWLSLREIGAAADNIPDASTGSMPADEILDWMENAVDAKTWKAFCAAHPAPFRLFGEDRHYAVRNDIIPAHWFAKGNPAAELFRGTAQPGEFYPFQVCVASDTARSLTWRAQTDLPVTCITPATCAVKAQGVKPIWVMLDIPANAAGKVLRGSVEVKDANSGEVRALPFEITVKGEVLADGGVKDAWRLARLKWLNSDIGLEDTVTRPYTPVTVDAATRTVNLLGRKLVLGADGFPAQITSFFNGSNTKIQSQGLDLLEKPFVFTATGDGLAAAGESKFAFTSVKATEAAWRAETRLGAVTRIVEGKLDFAGVGEVRVRFQGAAVKTAALEVRMPGDVARYVEGLGRNGGAFTENRTQEWTPQYNRDAVWCGRINGGLAIRFKGANYHRPFINAYYPWCKLAMPESWASGHGTISFAKEAGTGVVRAEAKDAPADAEWNFELYLTPFHPLDLKSHLNERYHHLGQRNRKADFKAFRAEGSNVITFHHNTIWNPYINYPYNDEGGPLLMQAIKDAHAEGLKLKVYYTTRELTQNLPEFFALKSLDGEIFAKRDEQVPGWPCTNRNGPHDWLCTHVGRDIIPAWRETVNFPAYPPRLDLAVITTPETRWDNFFLEGLQRLVEVYGIDGIYIDDTALSGKAMQRARRILDRDGKRRLVDNHSWNHHSPLAGNGSSNLVFLDLYPYFDLLWRGEGFSNDAPADFWLIERSGLPFGVPGEMLGRGLPCHGLSLGMTDRLGWGGNPTGLWKFFDEVKLDDAEFIGWWDDANPIAVTGSDQVKATLWQTPTCKVLVAANFARQPQAATFTFKTPELRSATWTRPAIAHVQGTAPAPDFTQPITLQGRQGFILVSRQPQRP